MRLEGLTVALRPRSSWEATDLGIALVRRHAGTIWRAWACVTLPVFLLLNAAAALLDLVWLAGVLFWWLKPTFDRVPLYILSRAVFGATPSVAEAVRAQRGWGWRSMLAWQTWRRLHPSRSLLLPVDLLEGLTGPRRRERVHVLQRATSGTSALTTLIGLNMEIMLSVAIVLLALMFVPVEFFSEAGKVFWDNFIDQPPIWGQLLMNLVGWAAMGLIEPFYVGAGFGLYLNRRTQLEAWDVELAFRRLAARLSSTAALLLPLLFGALLFSSTLRAEGASGATDQVGGMAAETAAEDIGDAPKESLRRVFAGQYIDRGDAFDAAVRKAYADPDLNPKIKQFVWELRNKPDAPNLPVKSPLHIWLEALGQVLAFIAENVLWILAALLLALIVRYHRVWLPWISDRFERARTPDALEVHDIAVPEQLPDDVPGTARTLWQLGRQRDALALLYRGGVAQLDAALGTSLPPGSTEAECLRRSRRLGDSDFVAWFARVVRCWQAAAYARRLPSAVEFDDLLGAWPPARSAGA